MWSIDATLADCSRTTLTMASFLFNCRLRRLEPRLQYADQPICKGVPVVQLMAPFLDAASVWTGGTIVPGEYELTQYTVFGTSPACSSPLA